MLNHLFICSLRLTHCYRYESAATPEQGKRGWADNIIISQDVQALIYKYVPISGPIFGSAFIIGLYMLSRLIKGDLTDRMNMMNQVS